MHQTISGETHRKEEKKVEIKNKEFINNFLKKDKQVFENFYNSGPCLYNSFVIDDSILNYVNDNSIKKNDLILKNLILNEFDELEKIYPTLGEIFLLAYYNKIKNCKFKSFLFRKNNVKSFIKSLKNSISENLATEIFNKSSLDNVINVKYKKIDQIIINEFNNINFSAQYDTDLIENFNSPIKNYNFVLIEGIIETVGEIHHLLYNASINKEHYVIFCLGLTQEVKSTILKNNSLGITKIHIVSLDSCEENLNILNDIAVIHNSNDIISASKGQTISQEIRKGLGKGEIIEFEKNGFVIKPLCSEEKIIEHRKFLKVRIEDADNEKNKKLLLNRSLKFQSKRIEIYLPELIKKNVSLSREINYVLSFFTQINREICKVKINGKILYIPAHCIKILENKLNNIRKTINNLDCLITLKQKR